MRGDLVGVIHRIDLWPRCWTSRSPPSHGLSILPLKDEGEHA